jgi:hypothetical protein
MIENFFPQLDPRNSIHTHACYNPYSFCLSFTLHFFCVSLLCHAIVSPVDQGGRVLEVGCFNSLKMENRPLLQSPDSWNVNVHCGLELCEGINPRIVNKPIKTKVLIIIRFIDFFDLYKARQMWAGSWKTCCFISL